MSLSSANRARALTEALLEVSHSRESRAHAPSQPAMTHRQTPEGITEWHR
jgi:hypothetical protein